MQARSWLTRPMRERQGREQFCLVWWWRRRGPSSCLLPLSEFFLSTSNSSSLVDCVAPGHTVRSKVRPLPVVDVAGSERLLQAVLESLLWSPFLTMASGKFAEHDDLWREAMVFHDGHLRTRGKCTTFLSVLSLPECFITV